MEHVLTMANLKSKPSLFIPRPTVHVYRAYVAWTKWRAQDVVREGHISTSPELKGGITCGHSPHVRAACREAQHGWGLGPP